MQINASVIEKFNPCQGRFQNFKDQYPDFNGSVEEFLSLDSITYSDKVWVCVRLMSRNQKFYWARACARSVLEIFESQRPNDPRVRELIDYMDTIKDVTKLTAEELERLRQLRYAAAYAAAAAAYAAAATAAYAAAYAAAAAAAYAAAYAAADAAYAAADAAARTAQEEYNLIILNEVMRMDI